MSSSENTPFFCRQHGMLWEPRRSHFPCPEATQSDGAGGIADIRSTMCYCSVTVLTQEEQQQLPTSASSGSDAVYFDARSTVDEHLAVDGPKSSGEGASHNVPMSSGEEAGLGVPSSSRDEASSGVPLPPSDEPHRDISELPFTTAYPNWGHTDTADDYPSPPWSPRRRRPGTLLARRFPWDWKSPTPLWASRRTGESSDEPVRFASPQLSFSRPQRNEPVWSPCREGNCDGAAMAAWASQQYQSLPCFSPPPPRYSSPGEGPSGLGGGAAAARRHGEAARGPDYPEHPPFIGSAGAQDNGPYPAPPPRPQQEPQEPQEPQLPSYPPRPSRFIRPRTTRWPTPQPPGRRRRLDLEINYCPAQHAPGAVASSRTYFPEHTRPATFQSSSANSWSHQNERSTSAFGVNNGSTNNNAAADRHLHASSASPSPSPKREPASESPGSSPPRHVFQAELNFVQPDDAIFTMAAATHVAPPASSTERTRRFWHRVRNVVRESWRRRRSRGEEGGEVQTSAARNNSEGYEALDDEAWVEIGQPADSDSGEIVDCAEGEAGPSVVTEAVRSRERFSMD